MSAGPDRVPATPERLRAALARDGGRFLVAGGLAAAVNWLVRFPLSLWMPFESAVALAYAIGMSVGFTLYRTWVFPGSPLSVWVQLGRFLGVNAAGALVVLATSVALAALLSGVGSPRWIAEGLGHGFGIAVGALVSFVGHRALTFAGRPTALRPQPAGVRTMSRQPAGCPTHRPPR